MLINGLGGNIEMWAPFRDAVDHRTTLAFDAPGSGLSTTPLGQPSIRFVVDALARSLDALGFQQVDVLGYSFGGVVAQEFARRHPTRVRRLVLAATTPGWGAPMPSPLALANLMTPARYYLDGAAEAATMAAFGERHSPGSYKRLGRARRRRPPSLYGYWWQLMAISGWSSLEWLQQLQVPCLVVTGEHDKVASPQIARLLAREIPHARLLIARRAGHLLLYSDRPHPAVGQIIAFLDEEPAEVTQLSRALAST